MQLHQVARASEDGVIAITGYWATYVGALYYAKRVGGRVESIEMPDSIEIADRSYACVCGGKNSDCHLCGGTGSVSVPSALRLIDRYWSIYRDLVLYGDVVREHYPRHVVEPASLLGLAFEYAGLYHVLDRPYPWRTIAKGARDLEDAARLLERAEPSSNPARVTVEVRV